MRRELFRKVASPHFINDMLYFVTSIILAVILSAISVHDSHAQINSDTVSSKVSIKDGDKWHYFKGLQKPPRYWNRVDLDVSNWESGPTGLGYGTETNRTYLDDMQGNYLTVYARNEFVIDNPASVDSMTISVVCDGPFIAYLNGIEMLRTKTVQISNPDQIIGVTDSEKYNVSGFKHELIPGKNILALQCDNNDINSEDFSFIPVFEVIGKWGAK